MSPGKWTDKIKIDNLIRSKRKSMSLEIKPDGSLIVRAPLLTTPVQIERLVKQPQRRERVQRLSARVRAEEAPVYGAR